MCQSKAQGGMRCPTWYKNRVEREQKRLDKITSIVGAKVDEVATLTEYNKARIKELKQEAFFTKSEAKKAAIDARIEKIIEKEKAAKAELAALKRKSGDAAEALELANEDLDVKLGFDHQYYGDTLGDGVLLGEFEQDSPEWHENRGRGIGGSDVGAILGVSPMLSRDRLFKMKTGYVPSTGSSGAAKIGHQFEPVIARRYAENHPEQKVLFAKASWKNKDREYQYANIDGLICENGSETPNAILEIKTSSHASDWVDPVTGEGRPPAHYRAQVLWYMSTFGIEKGYLAALINHTDYREYEIVAEPGEIDAIHAKVREFQAEVDEYNRAH